LPLPLDLTLPVISYTTYENAKLRFVPPVDEAEKMEYGERLNKGFLMAMYTDWTFSLIWL
jgi:hypothetical protein